MKFTKKLLLQLIEAEVDSKKHAMYDPETGKKSMADGEEHEELSKKGYVHYDPDDAVDALEKEGGAAGLDAIAKHTKADKKELEKSLSDIPKVGKHKKGDYILGDEEDIEVTEQIEIEKIIKEEIVKLFLEKRKKRKKKKKKKSSGKKDACYHKVKSRYAVWPSAYASGALVKCRKVGAKNWGNKSKKKK